MEWRDIAQVWAQVRFGTGRVVGGEISPIARQSVEITVRAAPYDSVLRPMVGQRFVDTYRVFVIDAVSDQRPTPLYITCTAHEEATI